MAQGKREKGIGKGEGGREAVRPAQVNDFFMIQFLPHTQRRF